MSDLVIAPDAILAYRPGDYQPGVDRPIVGTASELLGVRKISARLRTGERLYARIGSDETLILALALEGQDEDSKPLEGYLLVYATLSQLAAGRPATVEVEG